MLPTWPATPRRSSGWRSGRSTGSRGRCTRVARPAGTPRSRRAPRDRTRPPPGDPRPAGAFVDDLAATAAALEPDLAALGGPLAVDEVEMRGGLMVPPQVLPLLRLREVVFHHVDLDDGFSFADVEPGLLRGFMDDAVGRLRWATEHAPGLTVVSDEGDQWVVGDGRSPCGAREPGCCSGWPGETPAGSLRRAICRTLPRGS